MNFKKLLNQIAFGVITLIALLQMTSCEHLNEDLPECRLSVRFKFDYNMLSADAFHTQVDKVELYVFDEEGKFLFSKMEEGAVLKNGNYRMNMDLPVGRYKFVAWAGVHDSYSIPELEKGISDITDLKLKLKRDKSLIIDKELEPVWYGEIIDVNFTGTTNKTEVINLIKDTNKIRFAFQSYADNDDDWTLDMNAYDYEIIESNGYINYDNTLLPDDVISYQPYFKEQKSPSAVAVELNTMRLMADRSTRFVVTEKATGRKVFSINLIEYLALLQMEGHNWSEQEYLDRQDEYVIVFFFRESWTAIQININGWTYYIQTEGEDL